MQSRDIVQISQPTWPSSRKVLVKEDMVKHYKCFLFTCCIQVKSLCEFSLFTPRKVRNYWSVQLTKLISSNANILLDHLRLRIEVSGLLKIV